MTTKELLAELNRLRVENGKNELANWKSSREKLEQAIETEQQAIAKRMADEGEGINPEDQTSQPADDFQMSQEELDQQVGRGTDQEEQPSDLSDVEGQTETAVEEPLIPRGAIGAMSIELLTGSDEPYADIVAKIVAKYPTAKTTARSLASVAMDLRRDGVDVPSRRKPAKAKPAKTEEAASEPAGE